MKLDIFVRSYAKDIPFLLYLLRSIQKFATGYDKVVIVAPDTDKSAFESLNLTKETLLFTKDPEGVDGYMAQQITKCNADCFTEAQWIAFIDSDCFFERPFNLYEQLFSNNKPIILKTPYIDLPPNVPWQKPTSKALGFEVQYETMRRHPSIYKNEWLDRFRRHIAHVHGKSINDYIAGETTFSEFNAMGSYVLRYHENEAHWIDTSKDPVPDQWLYQAWSWGGLTNEIRAKYERLLK
jgi:hypothetical protein